MIIQAIAVYLFLCMISHCLSEVFTFKVIRSSLENVNKRPADLFPKIIKFCNKCLCWFLYTTLASKDRSTF